MIGWYCFDIYDWKRRWYWCCFCSFNK